MPEDNPLAMPELFIVTTVVLEEVQAVGDLGVPYAVKLRLAPTHMLRFPVITGSGFTVIARVSLHPLLSVKIMFPVPEDKAVTRPVLFTVNIVLGFAVQGLLVAAV